MAELWCLTSFIIAHLSVKRDFCRSGRGYSRIYCKAWLSCSLVHLSVVFLFHQLSMNALRFQASVPHTQDIDTILACSLVFRSSKMSRMGIFSKRRSEDATNVETMNGSGPVVRSRQKIPLLAVLLGLVASIGGFMFGYLSGQISGTNRQVTSSSV